MSAYVDELRATAAAQCDHPDGELCEHRSAALAYELIQRGPGVRFDMGALGAWLAFGLAFGLMLALAVANIVRWWFG